MNFHIIYYVRVKFFFENVKMNYLNGTAAAHVTLTQYHLPAAPPRSSSVVAVENHYYYHCVHGASDK